MAPDPRQRIHVLLHQVEGPVNLGAICRSMANTGFSSLASTGPLTGDEAEARKFAVHAKFILDQRRICHDLRDLAAPCDLVFGFTPRRPWNDGRNLDLDTFLVKTRRALEEGLQVGLLFGNEAHGLSNEDLAHCRFRVALPTSDQYASLNLAQAVMVVLWEVHRAFQRREPVVPALPPDLEATAKARDVLAGILRSYLDEFDMLNPQNPEQIWGEYRLMLAEKQWSKREMDMLYVLLNKARARYKACRARLSKLTES